MTMNNDTTQPDPLHNYQDDLDTDEQTADRITHEQTDDPANTFGVPHDEYAQELDGLDTDMTDTGDNDIRGSVENTDASDDQQG